MPPARPRHPTLSHAPDFRQTMLQHAAAQHRVQSGVRDIATVKRANALICAQAGNTIVSVGDHARRTREPTAGVIACLFWTKTFSSLPTSAASKNVDVGPA
jgi:hypothetical protein